MMLSEELRNLMLWMLTRQKNRSQRELPVDLSGDEIAVSVLDELAGRAERLEADVETYRRMAAD